MWGKLKAADGVKLDSAKMVEGRSVATSATDAGVKVDAAMGVATLPIWCTVGG